MSVFEDPRVREFRSARAERDAGLRASLGAHDRYRAAIGPYLDFMAEFCPEDSPGRRHLMAALFYDTGLPLGAVLAAFRATKEESEWVGEQMPEYAPEPVDEQQRLASLPYGLYLKTPHWRSVRMEALRRAGERCALCNSAGPLDVHHRTYSRRGAERPADVVVLCVDCHKRHHGKLRAA